MIAAENYVQPRDSKVHTNPEKVILIINQQKDIVLTMYSMDSCSSALITSVLPLVHPCSARGCPARVPSVGQQTAVGHCAGPDHLRALEALRWRRSRKKTSRRECAKHPQSSPKNLQHRSARLKMQYIALKATVSGASPCCRAISVHW